MLEPGEGFRDLFTNSQTATERYYSVLANAILTYLMRRAMRIADLGRMALIGGWRWRSPACSALSSRSAREGEKPVERDYAWSAPRRAAHPGAETTPRRRATAATPATPPPTRRRCTHARRCVLGCTDCHGGDAADRAATPALAHDDPRYVAARDARPCAAALSEGLALSALGQPEAQLHAAQPRGARISSASSTRRDYRVAREACGACHMEMIEAAERSLMATGAMFWGGAAYNNGIVPFKNYIFGEAYTRDGEPAKIVVAGIRPAP